MTEKRQLIGDQIAMNQKIYQGEKKKEKIIQNIRDAAKKGDRRKIEMLGRHYQLAQKHIEWLQNHSMNLEKQDMQKDTVLATYEMMKTQGKTIKNLKGVDNVVTGVKLQKMMDEYEKTSMNLELKMETMNNTMDTVFDHSDFAQDSDSIIGQIYDELHIEELAQFVTAPKDRRAQAANATSETKIDT